MDSLDNIVEIDAMGVQEKYQLLHVIEFDSTRKRMSVILRLPDGRVRIISKGADNVMIARISKSARRSIMKHPSIFKTPVKTPNKVRSPCPPI